MELGLYTFADVGPGMDPVQRLRNLVEEIELADGVGLDVFGVGEHHRPDYAVSSRSVALAAAARTKNICLTSAVTVLSSDDPVRVFQDFPTYAVMMNRIGRERGWSSMSRGQFEAGRPPCGALLVGSPEGVTEKILFEHELFGNERFMAQISVGTLPHEKTLRAIELFGTEVAPAVRKEVARRPSSASTQGPPVG